LSVDVVTKTPTAIHAQFESIVILSIRTGDAADNLRYIINTRRRRKAIRLQRVERVTDLSYRAVGAVCLMIGGIVAKQLACRPFLIRPSTGNGRRITFHLFARSARSTGVGLVTSACAWREAAWPHSADETTKAIGAERKGFDSAPNIPTSASGNRRGCFCLLLEAFAVVDGPFSRWDRQV